MLSVGGVEQKVRAAEIAGVDLFLVPAGNLEVARAAAGGMELLPVRTVAQAIRALAGAGE